MRRAYMVALIAVGATSLVPESVHAQLCVAGNRSGTGGVDCTLSPEASNCGCDWFDEVFRQCDEKITTR